MSPARHLRYRPGDTVARMKTFESLADLAACVGQEVAVSDWVEITQAQVNRFAEATGDHQWIHVDVERAKAGPFGGPIAHGFLTLSLLPVFFESAFDIRNTRMGVNYGLNRVRFTAPVPVGSRLRARLTLQAIEPIDQGGQQMTWAVVVEREGADKPVCFAESLVRQFPWARGPSGLLDADELLGVKPALEVLQEAVDALGGDRLVVPLRDELVRVVAQQPEFLGCMGLVDLFAQAGGGRACAVLDAASEMAPDARQLLETGRLLSALSRCDVHAEDPGEGGNQGGLHAGGPWCAEWRSGRRPRGVEPRGPDQVGTAMLRVSRAMRSPPPATCVTCFTEAAWQSAAGARLRTRSPPPHWRG